MGGQSEGGEGDVSFNPGGREECRWGLVGDWNGRDVLHGGGIFDIDDGCWFHSQLGMVRVAI